MTKPKPIRILATRAVRAAEKRIQFMRESDIAENLEYAADSMVEAYKIGAAEAQREIVARLLDLADQEAARAIGVPRETP